MTAAENGNQLSGLLNVNKPSGITSFTVVKQVRRILAVKKAGHCGTLDPLAEGVLLVLFGKATRQQERFMNGTKVYRTRIRLGVTTDTGDITGTEMSRLPVPPLDPEVLRTALSRFSGEITQVPPMYSALKVKGRKLYELAREGITVERQPRTVTIYNLELLGAGDGCLDLRVECSRGTYIRTLAEDIGAMLGCGGTMESLCREKVGEFGLESAVDGARLREFSAQYLLSCSRTIEALP